MIDNEMNLLLEVETKEHEEVKVYAVHDGEDLLFLNITYPHRTYVTCSWADDPLEHTLKLLKDTKWVYALDDDFKNNMTWVLSDGDPINCDWREYITEEEGSRIMEVLQEDV